MRYLYQDHFVDGNGRVIKDASVIVYLAGTTTPATIYSTEDTPTPITGSIVTTATDGLFQFWVDRADYQARQQFKLVLTKANYVSKIYDNVSLGAGFGCEFHYIGDYGNSLSTMVSEVDSGVVTIVVNQPITNSSTITIDENTFLLFVDEGLITNTGSITLTRPENIIVPVRKQIFAGSGTVSFSKEGVVLPEWWGAVADGVTECGGAIQAAMDSLANGGAVHLGGGTYTIGTGLTRTGTGTGRFALAGSGRRITTLKATAAIDMLSLAGVAGTLSGYLRVEGIYFDGDSVAKKGVDLLHVDYVTLEDIRIQYTTEEGICLDDAEDLILSGVHVFRCGSFANSKPGVGMYHTTLYNNSIKIVASTFERNPWHSVYCVNTSKLAFLGCKFHGRGEVDSPEEVDLLVLDNCEGTAVIGCQFANSRRRALHILRTSNLGCSFEYATQIIGNHFHANSIITGFTECGSIYLEDGFAIIDGNSFGGSAAETGDYSGYANIGYDIRLGVDCWGAVGTNVHVMTFDGLPSRVADDYLIRELDASYPYPMLLGRGGKRYTPEIWSFASSTAENALEFWVNGASHVNPRWKINHEGKMTWQGGVAAYPLFDIAHDGTLSWGGGAVAADVALARGAANRLDLAGGDSIKVDGAWDGGHVILNTHQLWVDASDLIRVKKGSPGSDTEGAILAPIVPAPSSAADTGTTGSVAFDSNYFYVCIAANTWKRVELSTW